MERPRSPIRTSADRAACPAKAVDRHRSPHRFRSSEPASNLTLRPLMVQRRSTIHGRPLDRRPAMTAEPAHPGSARSRSQCLPRSPSSFSFSVESRRSCSATSAMTRQRNRAQRPPCRRAIPLRRQLVCPRRRSSRRRLICQRRPRRRSRKRRVLQRQPPSRPRRQRRRRRRSALRGLPRPAEGHASDH